MGRSARGRGRGVPGGIVGRYVIRRLLLILPTLFGDHGHQFRPGAVRTGRPRGAGHRPGAGARHLDDGLGVGAHEHGAVVAVVLHRQRGTRSRVRRAHGGSVRVRQAAARAVLPHAVELRAPGFRRELLPEPHGIRPRGGTAARLGLARTLVAGADLRRLDPARHGQGRARRHRVRRLVERGRVRRLRDPRFPHRGDADHPVRRGHLPRLVPHARHGLRALRRPDALRQGHGLLLAPRPAPHRPHHRRVSRRSPC